MSGAAEPSSGRIRSLADQLAVIGVSLSSDRGGAAKWELNDLRRQFVNSILEQRGFRCRVIQHGSDCLLELPESSQSNDLVALLTLVFDPQLLCLDVDGTLVDVTRSFDLMVATLVDNHTGWRPAESDILAYRATGGFNDDFRLAQALMAERGVVRDLSQVAQEGTQLYLGTEDTPGFCQRETLLVAEGLLDRLSARLSIALVTGRNRAELAPALPMLQVPELTILVPVDRVSKGKPDPEGIHLAAESCGAQRLWMVGDNVDDIQAARAAGGLAIGVGPNRTALLAAGADWVLENINQIEELL